MPSRRRDCLTPSLARALIPTASLARGVGGPARRPHRSALSCLRQISLTDRSPQGRTSRWLRCPRVD
jgi:hypothetical protein